MGVLDLFTILAGGAWLTKETVREIGERGAEQHCAQLYNEFVARHSDLELEHQLRAQIEDPACYDKIWQRLELFKRDNPVWCREHEEKGRYDANGRYVEPVFGWQFVGKERLPFRSKYGSLYSNNQSESSRLAYNRLLAVCMLMQTYGKMSLVDARDAANKKYPSIPSKRKW